MKNSVLVSAMMGIVLIVPIRIVGAHYENNNLDAVFLNAAEQGDMRQALSALDDGASIDVRGAGGYTALMKAALNGHELVVSLCLGRKANVNCVSHYGDSALHLAADNGHQSVVEMLLDTKIWVDEQDRNGDTAWDRAKNKGHAEVARLLQIRGARVDPALWDQSYQDHETAGENWGRWEVSLQPNPSPSSLFKGACWGPHTKLLDRPYGTRVRSCSTRAPHSRYIVGNWMRRIMRVVKK